MTNPKAKIDCALKIKNYAISVGLTPIAFTNAPIRSGKNTEYLFYLKKGNENAVSDGEIIKTIQKST